MEYFYMIVPKLISFMIFILMGFVLAKKKIMGQNALSGFAGLLLKLILPCLVISLIYARQTTFTSLWSYHRIIISQMLVYFILGIVGMASAKLLKLEFPSSNLHGGCMIGSNFGFVVIPIMMALFTAENGQEYIPICSAVDTIAAWTWGLFIFTRGTGEKVSLINVLKKFLNPVLICTFVTLLINSLGIQLPNMIVETVDSVGNCSSSMGLIYLGCTICFLKLGNFHDIRPVFWIVACKLMIIPFLTYVLASMYLGQTEALILMLIAGSPSMTTSCMIARQYGMDESYAATAVFVTTMACMVTMPILLIVTAFI